ncbi:uncharacterized protein LOC121879683 [Homarus americanus]|uniref:Putative CCSMST1 family-like protein n=1 Tax=Homarus americanus TaxID=6706 RepID=A0A8J5JKF2_HOMAM|nr:uncharacterized protein LOC121879683 [Homarus americanus]KAG7157743.1 putative CCSMST1 family-like protein [Homarus americanus]
MNMATGLRICISPQLHSRLISINRATPNARHYTLNYNKPQTSSKPGGDTLQLLRVRGGSCVGSYQPIRYIAEWNTKRSVVGFTKIETIVVLFSLGTFMVYFMYLRESSDIDEYISQPIWKRVPGIDPERAEQMMLVDKHFGLQVDFSELEQYKRDYYAQKLADLEQEKQEIQRHQELRHSKNPHERPEAGTKSSPGNVTKIRSEN